MKILYQSDLHLEFFQQMTDYQLQTADCDMVVLAGDIGVAGHQKYIDWVLTQTRDKPTVLILGNHDAYGSSIPQALKQWKSATAGSHVHVLENETLVLNQVRFVGATLWTDYALYGNNQEQLDESMRVAQQCMSDHRQILLDESEPVRLFMPVDALQRHQQSVAFLHSALGEPFNGPTVVVTHHLPSPISIPARFVGSPMSPAFVSDLDHMILRYRPTAWIHGHSHDSVDATVGATRVLCNPRGYEPNELNPAFDPNASIDV